MAISLAALSASASGLAAERHYYIAAEDVTWDFAPANYDLMGARGHARSQEALFGAG